MLETSSTQQYLGLKKYHRPHILMSVYGCWAGENFDISSDFFPCMPIFFCHAGQDILRPGITIHRHRRQMKTLLTIEELIK